MTAVIAAETPTKDTKELKKFQRSLESIIPAGDKDLIQAQVKQVDGKFVANCNVCNMTITLGKPSQYCFNFKEHLKTSIHTNLILQNRESNSDMYEKMFKSINTKYPDQFIKRENVAMCKSCKNFRTKMEVTNKNLLSNLGQHLKSKAHNSNAEKLSQPRNKITTFFSSAKKNTAENGVNNQL